MQRDVVVGDVERDPFGEAVDRTLQRVVLERLEAAAAVAHEVVVMAVGAAVRSGRRRRRPRRAEQAERDQLVDDAVDRGAPDAPAVTGAQLVLDVERGQRARLLVQQLDHRLAGAAAAVAGAGEPLQRLLAPLGHRVNSSL